MSDENKAAKKETDSCSCGSGSCCGGKAKWVWVVLAVVAGVVVLGKLAGKGPSACGGGVCALPAAVAAPAAAVAPAAEAVAPTATAPLPRLVDLGATKCIPCKLMAPILEDLKKTYAGKLEVQFIDVWENPAEGPKYGIRIIPTQVFFDAAGKELFRHEGFFAKEDILAKWKELGVDLASK
jgi:thioredoxin 1